MDSFRIVKPRGKRVPIIVSIPHCGTAFPEDLRGSFKPELISTLDDTDWFVDKLYDFAPSLGITMISSVFHRWVIDLNRDPESKPLYSDGRIITGLCTTTDFLGNNIYRDERSEVSAADAQSRLQNYYWPYHHQLQDLIADLRKTHGNVLLWDCHSIRQHLPTISREKFPDLILGSADGTSASQAIIDTALNQLRQGKFGLSHNHPFKGGYITRQYGKPESGVHALQLEMCKIHYMDDAERNYELQRADVVRHLLTETFGQLIKTISA